MNKTELIETLSGRLGDRKAAIAALDAVLAEIQNAVTKGDKVSITGFGVFEKRVRAARTARNPRTGESVKVKKTSVPAFRPGTTFKELVAAGKLPKVAKAAPAAKTPAAPVKTVAAAAKRTAAAPAKAAPVKSVAGPARKPAATSASASRTPAKATKTVQAAAPAKKLARAATSTAPRSTATRSTATRSTAPAPAAKRVPTRSARAAK
jgi:DNA-binding protein HU-beta